MRWMPLPAARQIEKPSRFLPIQRKWLIGWRLCSHAPVQRPFREDRANLRPALLSANQLGPPPSPRPNLPHLHPQRKPRLQPLKRHSLHRLRDHPPSSRAPPPWSSSMSWSATGKRPSTASHATNSASSKTEKNKTHRPRRAQGCRSGDHPETPRAAAEHLFQHSGNTLPGAVNVLLLDALNTPIADQASLASR